MAQKYWDDFKIGDRVKTAGVTITETHGELGLSYR